MLSGPDSSSPRFIACILVFLLIQRTVVLGAQDNPFTAFVHVTLVPMITEKTIEDQTVLVSGTQIAAIGPSEDMFLPMDTTVIDGTGFYLMPGLADMHIHTSDDWDSWPVSPLHLFLANGVTTVRDMGPVASADSDIAHALAFALQLRDDIQAGLQVGPILYTSGDRIGHPSADEPYRDSMAMRYICQMVPDAYQSCGAVPSVPELVTTNNNQGFDFLKIYTFSDQVFRDALATAKALGMYTTGHIPFESGLDGVLENGMDEIAHIEELVFELIDINRNYDLQTWQDWNLYVSCRMSDELGEYGDLSTEQIEHTLQVSYGESIRRIADSLQSASIPVNTTLGLSELSVESLEHPYRLMARPECTYLPSSHMQSVGTQRLSSRIYLGIARAKHVLNLMLLHQLHQREVPLLLGTDCGTDLMGLVPGFSVHHELRILTEHGLTPFEAIKTGTVNAARVVEAMTGEGSFGTVEVGKRADLLLVQGNPLEDVTNVRNLIGVMAGGRWYSRESLEAMLAE